MEIDPQVLKIIARHLGVAYVAHIVRYALFAGTAYLLFYVFFRRKALSRKIQATFPKSADLRREISYSLLSFVVFCGAGLLSMTFHRLGWSHLYFKIGRHGWLYFWFSVLVLIFIHDTWFYWTHRLMHWKPLFPIFHRVHHLSRNPTPWASFAFHPLEALVQAIIFPLAILILPLHPLAAAIWLFYMTFMNVMGHLGFEILPASFLRNRILRWHNTSVHHNMHHRYTHYNYGLYFNIWDRLMGTNHPRYEEEFAGMFSRQPAAPAQADRTETPTTAHS